MFGTVYKDLNGDLQLIIPPELWETAGLNVGDQIKWVLEDNGTVIISKVTPEEPKLEEIKERYFLTEVESKFTLYYMVKTNGHKPSKFDLIKMAENNDEFHQIHKGLSVSREPLEIDSKDKAGKLMDQLAEFTKNRAIDDYTNIVNHYATKI